jgi:chemosensory pili system protein ChpA (sensor histidine kinase/response regulator)
MNPVQLALRSRAAPGAPRLMHTTGVKPALAPVVMVVDDSLTVRKITGRLLEREGYRVLTAKDGVDALQQMAESLPRVMLVDIEMPRMDGFDLARNVRGDPRTQAIPIVFISSRTAQKHRNQAAQLGVNAFLGKPYAEAELLQLVARYAA